MRNDDRSKVQLVSFLQHGDERGRLVVVEGGTDIPFEIKRIFYIFGSDKSTIRGQHANRQSEFVLISVSGSCKVRVVDSEGVETTYHLAQPYSGLFLPRMVWKDMYDFSEDSVLLVLASTHYDPEEYIKDFAEYLEEIHNKLYIG